jgi:hypothetical protein
MMGEVVAHNICNHQIAYNPGIWFNSAKFLDIEYQVYGQVAAKPDEQAASLYWEGSDGERGIRIAYDKALQHVLGFNLMGIRFRHEVCEKWIAQKTPLETVIQDLGLANFNPEFYPSYHKEVTELYNKTFGKSITSKRKSNLNSVIKFLKEKV